MAILQTIGVILIIIGTIFVAIGVLGLYRYKDFYSRAAIASLIDSAGFISISLGVLFFKGLSTFSLKVLLLLFLVLLVNPLANHFIVRGAHNSGHRTGQGGK